MRNEKMLYEMYEEARQQLVSIGFPYIEVPISLNGRMTKTFGWSCYNEFIEINKDYFIYSRDEGHVVNTIIHELSHQLVKETGSGHGEKWQDIARYIYKTLGYELTPSSNEERGKGYTLYCPKYTRFQCLECGNIHKPSKINGKRNKEWFIENCSCGKCKGKLKEYKGE